MGITRNPLGPLPTSQLNRSVDTTFWGPTQPPEIGPVDSDRVHLVRTAERLDNLAFQYLGDVAMGWIILLRNDIRLVPNGLVPGRSIFIPTRTSLQDRGVIA